MSNRKVLTTRKEALFADLTALCDFFQNVRNQEPCLVRAKYERLKSLETECYNLFLNVLEFNSKTTDSKEDITVKDKGKFIDLIDVSRAAFLKFEEDAQRPPPSDADLADSLLFQLSYNNLDQSARQALDLSLGDINAVPQTSDLLEFIRIMSKSDELKRDTQSKTNGHFAKVVTKNGQSQNSTKLRCSCCGGEHFMAYCQMFKDKPLAQKIEFVSKKRLCTNCLGNHSLNECWSPKSCRICNRKHHSLLHPIKENDNPSTKEEKVSTHFSYQNRAVLLSTATIVVGTDQNRQTARALIDQGSEASFVSESLVQRLRLKRMASSTVVSGVGSTTSAVTRGCVRLEFTSRHKPGTYFNTEALILTKLTDYLPPKINGFSPFEFDQLILADEDVFSNQPIEVILGAEMYALILQEGILRIRDNTVLLQNTSLGWIFCGAINGNKKEQIRVHCSTFDKKLLKNLERFWQMEEPRPISTQDDLNCEDYFQKTCQRTTEGRFVVRLPFKENPSNLGESRNAAYRALNYCEAKLSKNPNLSNLYHDFLQEYHNLGHMEVLDEVPRLHYFLPHHGVLRPSSSTTKLRVVFNASKKTSSGKSLNDILHIGPQLLPNVQDLFLRWRKYKIVFSADIEKMYRQILVQTVNDQSFQLILWKNQIYRLKTVTYGTACAPYLAMRVLRQLADEENLSLGKEIIYEETYMDDVLSGAKDEEEALEKQKQLIELLKRGGFVLRKWTSNAPSLLTHLPQNLIASSNERNCFPMETYSMLGIKWHRDLDLVVIETELEKLPSIITKRVVLSNIARLFDPLGYAAPILITSKIFLQSLWLCKLSWDDPLPEKLANQWRMLHLELESVHLKIPRWICYSVEAESIEIHGFSDASEKAMAAVLYISVKIDGIRKTSLLGSKTKVAPLKQISLPRLELTAALLLTRLLGKLISALSLPKIDLIRLWTDSTVTLYWIRNHPSRWATFVANHVSEIQTSAPQAKWSYVPSGENPADCATRGLTNVELNCSSLWWSGPSWLKYESESWPEIPNLTVPEVPEVPFLHSGVDYAGPLQIRTTKGRGHKSYKGYVAVFVCFFTRALHLEAVSDYTAEAFLAAYRRFSSRRGICASLTSDRGSNFVGAASLLAKVFDRNSHSGQRIAEYFFNDHTEWKFNPPAAPHFGGLWEAGVKSIKYHLKRVIGENTLTFEELSTLLCQIEAILNSRPLQPLSDDPEDLEPLTPAHFLVGQTLTALPEAESEIRPSSILSRWRLLQNQRLSFWKRWSAEYVQQLQRRNKWEYPNREIAVGDLVLVKQENTSPCRWPLARVLQLHRGSDGLVRVVTLKTAKASSMQRPIVKICPLLPSVQHQAASDNLHNH